MPTREWSPLVTGFQVNLQDSSARTRPVVGIGHHHTAATGKAGVLANFLPGGRTVTPNYFIAGTEIIGIVPESRRAFTSSSGTYDGQSITYEILNSTGDPTWGFSAETLATVKRLDAEIAKFYGIPFRHALPGFWEHKNVYQWTGGAEGYATACAGPAFRILEMIAGAQTAGGDVTPIKQGDIMAKYIWSNGRAGLLLKVSGIYYPKNLEEAQAMQDAFGGLTVGDRQWDVMRQACLNIAADEEKALGAVQTGLDAAFLKLFARLDAMDDDLTPDVDEIALAAALAPALAEQGIEAKVDAVELARVFLNASAERLAE